MFSLGRVDSHISLIIDRVLGFGRSQQFALLLPTVLPKTRYKLRPKMSGLKTKDLVSLCFTFTSYQISCQWAGMKISGGYWSKEYRSAEMKYTNYSSEMVKEGDPSTPSLRFLVLTLPTVAGRPRYCRRMEENLRACTGAALLLGYPTPLLLSATDTELRSVPLGGTGR